LAVAMEAGTAGFDLPHSDDSYDAIEKNIKHYKCHRNILDIESGTLNAIA
jgi:hypothetical protein